MIKVYKAVAGLLIIPCLGSWITAFEIGKSSPYSILSFDIMGIVCCLIMSGNNYIFHGVWLLKYMYRFRRYEFNIHWKSLALRILISYASLVVLFAMAAMAF